MAIPLPSVTMALGGEPPPRDPLGPPQSAKPLLARSLPAVILVPSTGKWRWGGAPPRDPLNPPHHSPSPSLAPSPLSFSWPPRESSPRPHSGFPPAGENDGGGGEGICRYCRVCLSFFRCHSRGLHGNPVLDRIAFSWNVARLPSPVTMAAKPQKTSTATTPQPVRRETRPL